MFKIIQSFVIALISSAALIAQAQTCNSSITATAPNSRYTVNTNATVTDNKTGLMWTQCASGLTTTSTPCDTGTITSASWKDALQLVDIVNHNGGFAGYSDWRLPNIKELETLVERQCYLLAINNSIFPNVGTSPAKYWTSTAPITGQIAVSPMIIDFDHGDMVRGASSSTYYIRLVRGGQ